MNITIMLIALVAAPTFSAAVAGTNAHSGDLEGDSGQIEALARDRG